MHGNNLLLREKQGKAYVYSPRYSKAEFERGVTQEVLSGLLTQFAELALSAFVELVGEDGEKRFSTSIARRLANTGALNKGDRRANQIGGLERFNLESKEGRAALKIVYDRVLAGCPIPGLENPMLALSDMGLLAKSENGDEEFLKESEKQNIVRFFNRLLSLEVSRQNALFEYFYKTYTETVEHLKASGKYDLGLEDIRAKSVKIGREPQLIHRDSSTGATTHLYELDTIVPNRYGAFRRLGKS